MAIRLYEPDGSSWDAVFDLSLAAKHLNSAVSLINRVHGTNLTLKIPVLMSSTIYDEASYNRTSKTITINSTFSKEVQQFSFVHEAGHLIDHLSFHEGDFATETKNHLLREWRVAMLESKAIKRLLELKSSNHPSVNQRLINYFLSSKEIFARSYSQYVASITQSPSLLSQLQARRKGLYASSFWSDNDFHLLQRAFDNLFLRKQWLKKK